MLFVNEKEIQIGHYPDGTLMLKDLPDLFESISDIEDNIILFTWLYDNDSELWVLENLVDYYRRISGWEIKFRLCMPYIPNARMDRIKTDKDVFTLKTFAKKINDLNFEEVYVLDPHSNSSNILINNLQEMNALLFFTIAISKIKNTNNVEDYIIYFPDTGAYKKYFDLFKEDEYFNNIKYCYGIKKRNWETGKIEGINVVSDYDIDLKDKVVIMIDDIVSYGGSMYYSALKLKDLGAKKIYAIASHTENSVLNKEKGTLIKALEDGTVEKLFTTNSIYRGKHKNVEIIELNLS